MLDLWPLRGNNASISPHAPPQPHNMIKYPGDPAAGLLFIIHTCPHVTYSASSANASFRRPQPLHSTSETGLKNAHLNLLSVLFPLCNRFLFFPYQKKREQLQSLTLPEKKCCFPLSLFFLPWGFWRGSRYFTDSDCPPVKLSGFFHFSLHFSRNASTLLLFLSQEKKFK